jgi:hypothetical protein
LFGLFQVLATTLVAAQQHQDLTPPQVLVPLMPEALETLVGQGQLQAMVGGMVAPKQTQWVTLDSLGYRALLGQHKLE